MSNQTIQETEKKMKGAEEWCIHELASLRTGRASISLVDNINVECYGSKCPLKQVANISVPESRLIIVHPWDKNILGAVEKALLTSNLGINPTNDGNVIRLNIPPLTEERRVELVKVAKKLAEEGRIRIRNIRREGNDELKNQEKAGTISEDESHRLQDEIQKLTDNYIKRIDDLLAKKEEEIMEF